MPKKTKKVKSLPAKNLTSKQAKGVKGGIIAVTEQSAYKVVTGDGSVKSIKAINFSKI